MKKFFLFLTLAVTLALSLSLFACGGGGNGTQTSTSQGGSQTSQVTDGKFLINVDGAIVGGKVFVDKGQAKEGETVTLIAVPDGEYTFVSFTVDGQSQTGNTFVMPNRNVSVSAIFSLKDYTVTLNQTTGGTVSADKLSAKRGETVTLSHTVNTSDNYEFVRYEVKQGDNDVTVNGNTFVMPSGNVTVSAVFEKQGFTVTIIQPSDYGTITANGHTSTFTAEDGATITLEATALPGNAFSSYKIDGNSQTSNTFILTKDVTIEAVFVKAMSGLDNYTFDAHLNNGGSTSGNVTINGNSVTNTQGKYPFVYSQKQGDFYFETELSLTQVYNNDAYPKTGIGIECNSDILFFFIDAEHFGTQKKVAVAPARGTLFGQNDFAWDWHNGSSKWSKTFTDNYTNGSYVKLGVMKTGGLFRFFVQDEYAFSVWAPNMDDTLYLGIFSFNTGYSAINAKFTTKNSVLDNVRGYYGILNSKNPETITVDGSASDWAENLVGYYGYTTGDSVSYFHAAAFKGEDAVYAIFKARVPSINASSSDWKNNTNVEAFANNKHFYADFNGHKEGISEIYYSDYKDVDGSNYYVLTIEAKIPYSTIGENFDSTSDISMRFAFCLTNEQREYFLDDDQLYWIEVGCKDLPVETYGLDYSRELAPTDKVVKTTDRMCADPYILLVDGTYYMYGTTDNGTGFRVFSSSDLVSWTDRGYCFNKNDANPVGSTNFWAPEVKYNAYTGKYVMFYSAGRDMGVSQLVAKSGVATSDSPLGPFVDANNGTPMLYPEANDIASIDATCFVDDDGQAYIFYSKDCSFNVIENYHNGKTCHVSQTWGAKLDATWTRVISDPVLITTPEQAWEFADGESEDMWLWNEGPFVFKENGKYYLTFSANYYARENYAVGVAIATSPLGTYVKYAGNPIVRKDLGKTSGTGHGMMFVDKSGVKRYVFHTFRDVNNEDPDTRVALIARLWMCDGIPTIEYKNW